MSEKKAEVRYDWQDDVDEIRARQTALDVRIEKLQDGVKAYEWQKDVDEIRKTLDWLQRGVNWLQEDSEEEEEKTN